MTNYEKIKAMSIEEMAKDISEITCNYCAENKKACCDGLCEKHVGEWLVSEAEEDMLPEICSCGYRFEADETICPNCGKKVEEDG